jgi:hypothetical protein
MTMEPRPAAAAAAAAPNMCAKGLAPISATGVVSSATRGDRCCCCLGEASRAAAAAVVHEPDCCIICSQLSCRACIRPAAANGPRLTPPSLELSPTDTAAAAAPAVSAAAAAAGEDGVRGDPGLSCISLSLLRRELAAVPANGITVPLLLLGRGASSGIAGVSHGSCWCCVARGPLK